MTATALFALLIFLLGFIAGRPSLLVSDPDKVIRRVEKSIAKAERDEERRWVMQLWARTQALAACVSWSRRAGEWAPFRCCETRSDAERALGEAAEKTSIVADDWRCRRAS